MMHLPPRSGAMLAFLMFATACGPDSRPTLAGPPVAAVNAERAESGREDGRSTLNAVIASNAQMISSASSLVPPGAPLAPFVEARLYAIANVAVHDALNAIDPRFARYADTGPIDREANAAAAALTAAHDAIVGADPGAASSTNAWYATAMAPLAGEEGVARGVTIGQRAAAAILARRADDHTIGGGVAPYSPGSNPGDYQFTFPFNTPGFNFFGTGGFADASRWGATVTPFVLSSGTQFRAPRPYGAASNAAAVLTARYTADFNEVKALGCSGCAARTAEQSEIAIFWEENSPTGWNRFATHVAAGRQLNAWDTARLFAVLEIGEFDAYTTSLESKYYYNFWRPVSAVALADADGNPATSSAPGWQVLAFPTPPVPDYPSAHATAGGAAAAIIEALVRGHGRPISTTSGSLPGVTRTFATPNDAAIENALSRIYIGFHFRHATEVGMAQGRTVGSYVASHALLPLHDDD